MRGGHMADETEALPPPPKTPWSSTTKWLVVGVVVLVAAGLIAGAFFYMNALQDNSNKTTASHTQKVLDCMAAPGPPEQHTYDYCNKHS